MRVLVTGANGFVAPHLARLLIQHGHEVHGLTRGSSPAGYHRVHYADLRDAQATSAVIERARPDAIVHLAAQSAVPASWEDPAGTLINNLVGEVNLFEAIRALHQDCRIVVAVSSDAYGKVPPDHNPVTEDEPFRPLSPYAVSKAAQDLLAYQYSATRHLDIVRLRTFNHLGSGQSDRFAIASFARQLAEIEQQQRAPVLETGDLSTERDYTDVRDIVRAYELAIEHGEAGGVYNVGSGCSYRIGALLEQLCAICQVPVRLHSNSSRLRPADVPKMVCDNRKFCHQTGWEPHIPIEQSLRDVLDDWRARVTAQS